MLEIWEYFTYFEFWISFLIKMKSSPKDANLWVFWTKNREKVDSVRKGTREKTAWTVSWVNLMNMLSVPWILWSEYANSAWKLRIVCRKTARSSYICSCSRLAIQTKQFYRCERQVYRDLVPTLRGFARTTSHQYRTPGYIRPFVGPTGFPDFGRGVDKPGWPVAMATLWIDPSKYHLRRRPKESPDFRE